MSAYQAQLARWLQLLATKGVQELALVNRPWPLDVPLRAVLFGIASIGCLYTGLWKFQDVARLLPRTSFHHLRELGICSVVMEDGDIDFVVTESPILETLSFVPEDIAVVKVPRLERLILEGSRGNAGGLCTKVRIGDAPKLHEESCSQGTPSWFLEMRDNIVMSENCDYEAGSARMNLNFWKLVKPTENVKSCIKVFSYKEFRGELGEVVFLKFFFRSARVLRTVPVSMANPSFMSFSMDEATHKAHQASNKMASSSCEMVLLGGTGPEGGMPWSFKTCTDYSVEDPFSVVQICHKA
ncbi:hypothetical protein VPH35_018451 [Triticum aestivum]